MFVMVGGEGQISGFVAGDDALTEALNSGQEAIMQEALELLIELAGNGRGF